MDLCGMDFGHFPSFAFEGKKIKIFSLGCLKTVKITDDSNKQIYFFNLPGWIDKSIT